MNDQELRCQRMLNAGWYVHNRGALWVLIAPDRVVSSGRRENHDIEGLRDYIKAFDATPEELKLGGQRP